ncbi:hypothetical protein [Streptomyces mirabilis]|uniref:hypothetical protein n=1 Tax=Streptomyces mirabilis TaxID=68239 RepID=UPI0036C7E817
MPAEGAYGSAARGDDVFDGDCLVVVDRVGELANIGRRDLGGATTLGLFDVYGPVGGLGDGA